MYEQGMKDAKEGRPPQRNQGSEYALGYARGTREAAEAIRATHYTPEGYWDLDNKGAF